MLRVRGCVDARWRRSFCWVRVSLPCEAVVRGMVWSMARDVADWFRRRPDKDDISMSGVRGVRLGGVDEMKWEMGFEGGICGSEPPEEGFSV